MRIQVDARLLRGGGIGRYLRELTSRWLASPEVESIAFVGRPRELEPWLSVVDIRGVASIERLEAGPYSPWAQVAWPRGRAGRGREWDVTFFPHYDVPILACPRPAVVTVHDLIHYQAPEGFPAWKRKAGAVLLRSALRHATGVVAVSHATADALIAFEPSSAAKTRVVHNGISGEFLPPYSGDPPSAEAPWGRLRPFFLTVAPAKAHKNLALAVEALAGLPRALDGTRLVMVGIGDALPPELRRLAARFGVVGRIFPLGAVEDADLRWLYRNCAAFLWPSTAEGFGFPPLEALGCGARVLASHISTSRELLGDVAQLLPPDDPRAWSDALAEALRAPSRCDERRVAEVLAGYTWDTSAKETLRLLGAARIQA